MRDSPRNIIAMGYEPGEHIHVICNEEGLSQLPESAEVLYRDGGGGLPIGVKFVVTNANLVALRLMGVLTGDDVNAARGRRVAKEV